MSGKAALRNTLLSIFALLWLIARPAFSTEAQTWRSVSSPSQGVSLSFPSDAVASTAEAVNAYDALIHTSVVAAALNPVSYKGTNLRAASVSVSSSEDPEIVASCRSGKAMKGETPEGTVMLDGVSFARFSADDAGAGSRWSWTLYRAVQQDRCYEIVEQLSWTVLENYPAGAVKAFDRARIEAQLHAITRHFKFDQLVGVPPSR